jgi:protein-tyrosine-phosphatase
MSDRILFLCPHNAAKGVIAAAYFNRFAQQIGLLWVADSAGTEHDLEGY